MSRGDQRERDRAKNLAKLQAKQGGSKRDGNPEQRNAEDKAKLAAKVEMKRKKEAEAAAKAQEDSKPTVTRKKVPKKKDDSLDDLLNAGLSATKKKGKK